MAHLPAQANAPTMHAHMKRLPAYPVYLAIECAFSIFTGAIFTVATVNQVQRIGLDPLQLVLTGTALELSAFVAEVPTGVVADTYGRRLSIVISFLLVGLGFIVEGLVLSFGALLLAQVVWGVGWTFHSGALEAWLVDEVGQDRAAAAFARAAQLHSVFHILGVIAGTALAAVLPVNVPIVIGGALTIGLGVFLALFMPETGFIHRPRRSESLWHHLVGTFVEGLRVMRGKPLLMLLVGVGVILGAYSEGFDRLWTAHVLKDVGLPAAPALQDAVWIGLMRIAGLLASAALVGVARRRLNQDSDVAVSRRLTLLSSAWWLALIAFALAPGFGPALAAYVVAVGLRGALAPILLAWINQQITADASAVRATILSTFGQADALGQIAGGPVVGAVGNASLRAALLFSAGLLLPAIGLFARTARRKEP